MKLVFLFGNTAVGKMTVGQELAKITELSLFYNHMTIEPVIEVFGEYNASVTEKLREVIFSEFAKTDKYGMIFTFMWGFDLPSDWEYIEHVKSIFAPYDTTYYYVELTAPQSVRLERNHSENRLKNKRSKRDIEDSDKRLISCDERYRCESREGEITFPNYIKIDNSSLSAKETAEIIKRTLSL